MDLTTVLGSAINASTLEGNLATALMTSLGPLVQAEAADLRSYGLKIASHFVTSIRQGNQEWTDELKGQVKALYEILRIRALVAAWDTFEAVCAAVFKGALAAIGAAIPFPK